MNYISTRGDKEGITASQAIIKGLCDDGGLYVPSKFPDLRDELKSLSKLSYCKLALYILDKFLDDFSYDELMSCIEVAYGDKFDNDEITPVKKINKNYFLELYHGPTLAFKDIALTLMPYLLKTAIKKNNLDKEILILTATSGDTGKAALEGFKDVKGIKIVVFFPEDGVSPIQKLQMRTQEGNNLFVAGIKGNFDDAQTGVKEIFSDKEFNNLLNENGCVLSSANSINIGRLLPQVVYYFYSYFNLVNNNEIKLFDKINFVVPTGNFGDILAGYYAKEIGLPINKLICASNENNVLYNFLKSGEYNKNRKLKLTSSPSMDILISSNLERLLFEASDRDSNVINKLINDLNKKGYYKISNSMKDNLHTFIGYYATDDEVSNSIKDVFKKYSYLIDTHTAVAYHCMERYKSNTHDRCKSIILSTASPFKFSKDVLKSLDYDCDTLDDFQTIDKLSSVTNVTIPNSIKTLKNKSICHENSYKKDELELVIKNFLGI